MLHLEAVQKKALEDRAQSRAECLTASTRPRPFAGIWQQQRSGQAGSLTPDLSQPKELVLRAGSVCVCVCVCVCVLTTVYAVLLHLLVEGIQDGLWELHTGTGLQHTRVVSLYRTAGKNKHP